MLPKETIEKMLKHTDPEVAAVALKLKETLEQNEYVPRKRIDELTKEKLELETQLKALDDAKKAADLAEAQRKGDLQKLLDAEKVAREAVEKQLAELKPLAEQAKKLRETTLAKVKEKLGDKFLPEYETFSLDSLGKLVPEIVIGTEKVPGGSPIKVDVKSMDEKSFKDLENKVMSGQKVAL